MTRSPSVDVAVVGGGLVGACVAYELACAGAGVALIDASLPGRSPVALRARSGRPAAAHFGDRTLPDEPFVGANDMPTAST